MTPQVWTLHLNLLLSVVARVVRVWHRNRRCYLLLFSSVVATFIPSCLVMDYCSWEWITWVLLGRAETAGFIRESMGISPPAY